MHQVVGNDLHFIANMAFMGMIKQFDFIGYHKNFGGLSASPRSYARAMNDSRFAEIFPHIKIAYDASREVLFRSPFFKKLTVFKKLGLAIAVFWARIFGYYYRVHVWSRVQRRVIDPILGKRPASSQNNPAES
jgi:hypothetical protein